jgi:adhesin transport system outer membrane protein
VRTARLNKEVSFFNLLTTRQNTLFAGANTYIDVLRQQRLVELSRENEATIQRQLNLEDERVQRGSGVTVDVLQAKSRLQIAKERRVNFEGAMVDPVPPIELIPSTLERAVEIAIVENPTASSAVTNIEVARERRRSVMSELAPTVDLEGQFNFEKHADATIGVRRDYSLMLTASWDLFTGFSTRESLSQATYDYRASQDNRDDTTRKVIEQTRLAWQALLTARARLSLLENAVNIASEVFDSRKRLREAGKETVINVLAAEDELSNSQINFTSAAYDERLAVYQLLRAMGRLNAANLGLGSG